MILIHMHEQMLTTTCLFRKKNLSVYVVEQTHTHSSGHAIRPICVSSKFLLMSFHVSPICNLYYLPKIQYFKINCPKQSSVSLITVHGTKNDLVRESTVLDYC